MLKNYPIVLQENKNDCGIASLSMIFNYHGINLSYEKIKKIVGNTENGTNALQIIKACSKVGIKATGVSGELENIPKFPVIAHLIIDGNFSHFVVIYNVNYKDNTILIGDPDKGLITSNLEEFKNKSSKIFLLFEKKNNKKVKNNRLNKFLFNLVKENKNKLIKALILSMIVIVISLIQSLYVKKMLENINSINNLYFISFIFLIIVLSKNVLDYLKNKYINNLNIEIDTKLKSDTYKHLFKLPYQYLNSKEEGDLFTIISDLTDFKDSIVRVLFSCVIDLLMIASLIMFLFFINKIFILCVLIIGIIMILLTFLYNNSFYNMFLIIKRKSIVSTSYLLELLSSVETIKNLNIYNKVSNKLNEKYLDYTKELKKYNLFYNKFELLKSVTSDTMFIFSIMISSLLVFKGRISIYDLVLFESIFYTFSGSLKDLLDNVIISKNYQVGIDRVLDLYDVKEEKTLDNKITSFNSINISNLNFSYDDKKIFNNLNLKIKRGDKILFVGKSGSGKTTLIHLLLKYFNNYQGKIEIDGTNLKKIDSFSIRNVVGYVSQNEKLYSDTIYNNLTLGGTYINNIDEVCNISKVNEFLKNKNITMDYYLDKESSNLSGGEKKRLMLARVLLKNNSILILDEVFNEIDIKMEKEILENLFKAYKNKTIIVISHRDTNYKLFDKYWKIKNYKIMEGESYEKIKWTRIKRN